MKNLKIKVIVGYRKDQHYSIDAEEAHKAYYLFTHPKERGVFKNGLALRGEDIQAIEPDINGSMGWNPTHTLENEDWNEVKKTGIERELRNIMAKAKEAAALGQQQFITKPLSEVKLLT